MVVCSWCNKKLSLKVITIRKYCPALSFHSTLYCLSLGLLATIELIVVYSGQPVDILLSLSLSVFHIKHPCFYKILVNNNFSFRTLCFPQQVNIDKINCLNIYLRSGVFWLVDAWRLVGLLRIVYIQILWCILFNINNKNFHSSQKIIRL